MTRYRQLIFDFDGTLADSAGWFLAKYGELAPELGLRPLVEADVHMLRGRTTREIIAFLGVPFWKLPRIAARFRAQVAAEAERIALFAGVERLLPELKQRGFTLAIVSSNSEDNVRRILGPGNSACIDVFACSASLLGKARKLRAVSKRTGIPASATLCIGDETRDIEAAREAGADAAAVTWGYANAEALARSQPRWLVHSLDELLAVLAQSER
jgi:phosphoglycolate phosphatase